MFACCCLPLQALLLLLLHRTLFIFIFNVHPWRRLRPGSDRSVALYDVRTQTPLRKLVMQNKCTKLAWNPMEAFNFTVANEDTNLYSYDMVRG